MLSIEGLGKRYGSRWIFRGLGFHLQLGDRLAIIGPNGSGKSTLIAVIAGLIPASEGRIRLPDGDARRTVGWSALEGALYSHLTGAEHLELVGELRGCPTRVDELLELVGLTYAGALPCGQMSTGMKARIKLAMAIQSNPTVLLLDEPGAGLDDAGRALVTTILREQSARGCAIIATNDASERKWATHELELAS